MGQACVLAPRVTHFTLHYKGTWCQEGSKANLSCRHLRWDPSMPFILYAIYLPSGGAPAPSFFCWRKQNTCQDTISAREDYLIDPTRRYFSQQEQGVR